MAVHRITSRHWAGKALGAAAAFVFAPAAPVNLVWWLGAGIAVGHVLDSVAGARPEGSAAAPASGPRPAGLRFAFAALGRIAEASGAVGPEHERCAERLMARLALSSERHQEALVWFHAGRDPTFPFDTLAASCRGELDAHPVLRDLTVENLCRMCALADCPAATQALLSLGERIGCDREELARHALVMAALLPTRPPAEQACDALGVRPEDGPDTVRLAYRRRVSRWHPDRLSADASDDERALAERRMCQLRDALDTLLAAAR